jgi:hypothetical protein
VKDHQFQQGHIGLYKREVQRERDAAILASVAHYGVLTPELVQILIPSPLRVLQRRMHALARTKRLIRYETLDKRVCYATEKTGQIEHRLLIAEFRLRLDQVVKIENLMTDAELRMGDAPTGDFAFTMNGYRHFFEADTGTEAHGRILEKCRVYKEYQDRMKKGMGRFPMRVLFLCVSERRVENLQETIGEHYPDSYLFWFSGLTSFRKNPLQWRVANSLQLLVEG